MRPLDDVLVDAKEIQQRSNELGYLVDSDFASILRELEEWEAKLAEECRADKPIWPCTAQLAEVRQLLGRGEPWPIPLNRDGDAPADLEQLGIKLLTMPEGPKKDALRKQIDDVLEVAPKPRPASPAMRALVAACEKQAKNCLACKGKGVHHFHSFVDGFQTVPCVHCKDARAALALARAELGEEATDA